MFLPVLRGCSPSHDVKTMLSSTCTGRESVFSVTVATRSILIVHAAWFAEYVAQEERQESEDVRFVLSVAQPSSPANIAQGSPMARVRGEADGLGSPSNVWHNASQIQRLYSRSSLSYYLLRQLVLTQGYRQSFENHQYCLLPSGTSLHLQKQLRVFHRPHRR